MTRDMSRTQFRAACERSGFVPEMLGYYRLPIHGHHIAVNVFNAGDRRRDRLAYLHAELERVTKKVAREATSS